jgi:hypothetical protein
LGLSASRACNLLLCVHRGIPRTALVVKATTLAGGHIQCRTNLDIPTEAVVTVNLLIGAPRRPSAHVNFQQSPKFDDAFRYRHHPCLDNDVSSFQLDFISQ